MVTSRSLHCLRCARPAEGFDGCRTCAAEGVGVNAMPPLADLGGVDLTRYPGGPWGLPAALPVSGPPVTLGEGNTPLIRLRDAPDRDGGHEERPCRQGLDALWRSGGTAVAVDDEAISAEHRRLAAEGLLLEPSSAVGVAVARAEARTSGALVVAIGTATGLKGLVG
ncbi:hypothetical protein [Streptomyces platensis]|uniref:hypothetical protein n=1 Tax=Streptomyces platensis TaxID=58346 RepID=UPI002E8168BF|nr:hypothetical protein [Streptomyces platensis]WUB78392.1 hypothetical protein OG424_03825 [Streptomyces platensis]